MNPVVRAVVSVAGLLGAIMLIPLVIGILVIACLVLLLQAVLNARSGDWS